MRNQGRRHAHVRPAVATQELDAARLEFELFVAEYLGEGVAAALRPFGVVIARHQPVGIGELVEHGLGHFEFAVGAEIGDVAAQDRELDIRLAVDVGDAALEVLNAAVRAFADMDVTQIGEAHRRGLCCRRYGND